VPTLTQDTTGTFGGIAAGLAPHEGLTHFFRKPLELKPWQPSAVPPAPASRAASQSFASAASVLPLPTALSTQTSPTRSVPLGRQA
jgi:hypothetical protein